MGRHRATPTTLTKPVLGAAFVGSLLIALAGSATAGDDTAPLTCTIAPGPGCPPPYDHPIPVTECAHATLDAAGHLDVQRLAVPCPVLDPPTTATDPTASTTVHHRTPHPVRIAPRPRVVAPNTTLLPTVMH